MSPSSGYSSPRRVAMIDNDAVHTRACVASVKELRAQRASPCLRRRDTKQRSFSPQSGPISCWKLHASMRQVVDVNRRPSGCDRGTPHRSGNGLSALDVQEMPGAIDGALLDLGRAVRKNSAGSPTRLRVGAQHRQHRLAEGGRLLGAEPPGREGGQLDSEEVSASLTAWATAPGRRSSSRARHEAQSTLPTALMKMASVLSWSPLPYASAWGRSARRTPRRWAPGPTRARGG